MSILVGVTGGIGSGKSTVCKIFATLGIPVYNADEEAKRLYDTDLELKESVIKQFGEAIYPNGKFDKRALREIVFRDDEKLTWRNSMLHPRGVQHAAKWFATQTQPYVIKEAALMIESGSYKQVDKLIAVLCPEDIRIRRVKERDGLHEQAVLDRIEKQVTEDVLRAHADYIILNDDKHTLIPQIMELHKKFKGESI